MSNCKFAPVKSGVEAATIEQLGVVRPDGSSITIDEDGVISAVGGTSPGGEGGGWTTESGGIESKTGMIHNGKPVYFKQLDLGAGPNNTTRDTAHGVAAIDMRADAYLEIRAFRSNLKQGDTYTGWVTYPYASSTTTFTVGITADYIQVYSTTNMTSFTFRAFIYYQKTTD